MEDQNTGKVTTEKTGEKRGAKAAQPESALSAARGQGDELHQTGGPQLTTNHGIPIADNQNALRAGVPGPTLLEDFWLREKIFHFDHERIPERIVHARGSAAHGVFTCTDPLPDLTRAALLSERGKETPVFVRFSTVAGGAGSVDTPRDVRGFAVKFYTEQGNWDLVGNNIPVFFVQDAVKFPDLVHAVKMEADRGYPQAGSAHDTFWDFVALMPETLHAVTWAMSDRGIPRSLRMMEGFGVHTFRLVNDRGDSRFVKFHWKPRLGVQSLLWDESTALQGADNDFHRRDLYEAIAAGDFPVWDLALQIFDQALADSLPYDVLDPTKIIPEEVVPLRIVGQMVLNRNPDNHFAETEQVAFLPSNLVPGIDFSDDPLLQGRLFSYLDTQKSRLGTTNFHQIPINAPKCPYANMMRDGLMQTTVPKGRATYEPNGLQQAGEDPGPRASMAGFVSARSQIAGAKQRLRPESFADHHSQPGLYWRSLSENEQAHTASSFVFELSKVTLAHVRPRVLAELQLIDRDLAARVAAGLGEKLPAPATPLVAPQDLGQSAALSIQRNWKSSLEGRRIGLLIAEGSDKAGIDQVISTVEAQGGRVQLIAPRVGRLALKGGEVTVEAQLAGTPSVLFDAVAMVLMPDQVEKLQGNAAARAWLSQAWAHLKAIGHCKGSAALFPTVGIPPDAAGVVPYAQIAEAAKERYWAREAGLRDLA